MQQQQQHKERHLCKMVCEPDGERDVALDGQVELERNSVVLRRSSGGRGTWKRYSAPLVATAKLIASHLQRVSLPAAAGAAAVAASSAASPTHQVVASREVASHRQADPLARHLAPTLKHHQQRVPRPQRTAAARDRAAAPLGWRIWSKGEQAYGKDGLVLVGSTLTTACSTGATQPAPAALPLPHPAAAGLLRRTWDAPLCRKAPQFGADDALQ